MCGEVRRNVIAGCFYISFLILGSLGSLAWLIHRAVVGPEISDVSYYILNNLRPETLHIQLQQFGTLWKALIGNHTIYTDRVIHILLIYLSTALGSYFVMGSLSRQGEDRAIKLGLSLFPAVLALCYFSPHLPDFSYNSGAYLGTLGVASSLVVLSQTSDQAQQQTGPSLWIWGGVLGWSFVVLGLVKPPSAVLLFLVVVLLFLLSQRRFWTGQAFLHLVAANLTGALLLLLLIALRVKAPWALFGDMWQGYESMVVLQAHHLTIGNEVQKFTGYYETLWDRVLSLVGKAPLGFMIGFLVVVMPLIALRFIAARHRHFALIAAVGLAVLSLWLVWPILTEASFQALEANLHLGHFWLALVALVGLFSLDKEVVVGKLPWLGLLFWGFVFTLIATTNNWFSFSYMHTGLTAIAVAAVVYAMKITARLFAYIGLGYVLLWHLFPAYERLENFPYRLAGPLSQASVTVYLGPSLGTMRLPPVNARPYQAVAQFREEIGKYQAEADRRLTLIDLSGRLPGLALFLDMDTGPIAWNAGGYPGSDAYIALGLGQLDDEALKTAWIVYGEKPIAQQSFDFLNKELDRIGRQFPRDYDMRASFPFFYLESSVMLFSPKQADQNRVRSKTK